MDATHGGRSACPADFDHNSAEHSRQPVESYKSLRSKSPVTWSNSNGGYWIVSGHAEVAEVAEHPEIFSSAMTVDEEGRPHGGIFIPAEKGLVAMIPTEVDPPLWRDYRLIFSRHFSPSAVEAMRPLIEQLTAKHIDRVIERGSCDLVVDIAGPIPANGILMLLGLDVDEWDGYDEPFHNALGYPPGSPEFQQALEDLDEIVRRIRGLVQKHRNTTDDGLLSAIMAAQVNGQPITDEAATSVIYSLFSGGVDTTTTLLANAFMHLGSDVEARRELLKDNKRIKLATEEFMRWASPVQALGRTVVTGTVLGGELMRPGERVLIAWAAANRDEKIFQEPDRCVLDRFPNRHVGFGLGIHRCAGAYFARMQMEVILGQVLERMPDYRIDETKSCQYPNLGIVNGWIRMPTSFTPKDRQHGLPEAQSIDKFRSTGAANHQGT